MNWRATSIPSVAGLIGAAGLSLLIAQPASAQSSKSSGASATRTQPPVPSAPHATSAAFGDWILQCQKTPRKAKTDRVCAVTQVIQMQGQGRVAQLSLQRAPKSQGMKLFAYLPANIMLPGSVVVGTGGEGPNRIEIRWRYCLPGGCAAEGALSVKTLKAWRAKTGKGRINFQNASGQDAVIPFSYRGLAQALDALKK